MGMFSQILPSSKRPETYFGFPADMDNWNCAQWKAYYLNNKKLLGKDKALEIVDIDSERVGIFANVHSCKYDCEWVNFFASEGLKVDSLVSKLYCSGTGIITNTVDTVKNATGVAKNVTGFGSSITSSKIVTGLIIAGILYGGYRLATSDTGKGLAKRFI